MYEQCDATTYSDDGKRIIRCGKDALPEHTKHAGRDPETGKSKSWKTGDVTPLR